MSKKKLFTRMKFSAQDFLKGVKPALENELSINIYPIEDWKNNELANRFDQAGIDGFYFNQEGNVYALASRVNYSERASKKPIFTFRYKLYNQVTDTWDDNREYNRKLSASNSPEKLQMFPKLHVESFSKEKGSGKLGWSFAAYTKDILNYINDNIDNNEKVFTFEPKSEERREVVAVYIEAFAKEFPVIPVKYK